MTEHPLIRRAVGPPGAFTIEKPIRLRARGHLEVGPSDRPVVLIAEKLSSSVLDLLGDEVEIREVDGTDRPALLAAVADADALLVRSSTLVDPEVLAASTRLKVVARAGVGLDNVDVPASTSCIRSLAASSFLKYSIV